MALRQRDVTSPKHGDVTPTWACHPDKGVSPKRGNVTLTWGCPPGMGMSPRHGDVTHTREWHPEAELSPPCPHQCPHPPDPLSRCRSNASWISRRGEPCATSWQPPINSRATKDGEHPSGRGSWGGRGGEHPGVPLARMGNTPGCPWPGWGRLWGCHLRSTQALGRVPLCDCGPCWGSRHVPQCPPPPSPNLGVLRRRPELWLS